MADEGFKIDDEATAAEPTGWRRTACRLGNAMMALIAVLASLALLATAYAQRVPPSKLAIASIAAMAFPAAFWVAVTVFGVCLARFRRTAWIPGLALLACAVQIHSYMPMRLPRLPMSQEQKERSFTFMTYNVMKFYDNEHTDAESNRQLAYILEQNPDVAVLEEAQYISPTNGNRITQEELDTLHRAYPYVLTQGQNFAILSKFPVEPINLDFPAEDFVSGDIAGFRLDVRGTVVNVFPVHLRSFSLTDADKSAYQDIVRLDSVSASDLKDAHASIVPKISQAAVERTEQVRYLQKYLQRYGGRNAIVAGDFNDTENSYGIYLLCSQCRMRQAFENTCFWPMTTYNANDLFFRIDHVLYRGDLDAVRMKRGSLKASDHYPLIVTFTLR